MLELLINLGVEPTQARAFAGPLELAMGQFGISGPAAQSMFIAQAMVESAKFTRMEENLRYTTAERICAVFPSKVKGLSAALPLTRNPKALANVVYAGKNGNGDEASGDGWRYRGRGVFQLTGRTNYQAASEALGIDLVGYPDLVAQPDAACMTAAWYWANSGCATHMKVGNLAGVTKAINGRAMLHHEERMALYNEVMAVFA